jgi:hypothetical protein
MSAFIMQYPDSKQLKCASGVLFRAYIRHVCCVPEGGLLLVCNNDSCSVGRNYISPAAIPALEVMVL